MYRDEGAWRTLMERLARSITRYLNGQIAAGAQCVQLFDSWVGCLGVDDYRRYVLPYVKQIMAGITPGVPVINFATGNPALLPLLAEAGGQVIGVDWRVRLDEACRARQPRSAGVIGRERRNSPPGQGGPRPGQRPAGTYF
jgi:uroporphyrinogen-III decarboxylase